MKPLRPKLSFDSGAFLTDELSSRVADKIGVKPEFKKTNKGMIGIAGHFPTRNAELAIELVRVGGEEFGYKDDQDHPEVMSINLGADSSPEYLRDQLRMLSDMGCDVIAIPESGISAEQKIIFQEFAKPAQLIYLAKGEQRDEPYESLASRTLDMLGKVSVKRRPDIFDGSRYDVVLKNLQRDIEQRNARIANRKRVDVGYPVIQEKLDKNKGVFGVIGGAGPMSSAEHSRDLAQMGVPHILYQDTAALYKIKFAKEEGHSFLAHYKNAALALMNFGCTQITIPCNTAHLFKDIIFAGELGKLELVDITNAVSNYISTRLSSGHRMALLGTEATVFGMDSAGRHIDGLYDFLEKQGFDIIKPDTDVHNNKKTLKQQERITQAIFDAKAGKMSEARQKILEVVGELKKEHGADFTVLLVCTDLPIAFNTIELESFGVRVVSSISALSEAARERSNEINAESILSSSLKSDRKSLRSSGSSEEGKPSTSIGDLSAIKIVRSVSADHLHFQGDVPPFQTLIDAYNVSYTCTDKGVIRIYLGMKDGGDDNRLRDLHYIAKMLSEEAGIGALKPNMDQLEIRANKFYVSFRSLDSEKINMVKEFLEKKVTLNVEQQKIDNGRGI